MNKKLEKVMLCLEELIKINKQIKDLEMELNTLLREKDELLTKQQYLISMMKTILKEG